MEEQKDWNSKNLDQLLTRVNQIERMINKIGLTVEKMAVESQNQNRLIKSIIYGPQAHYFRALKAESEALEIKQEIENEQRQAS